MPESPIAKVVKYADYVRTSGFSHEYAAPKHVVVMECEGKSLMACLDEMRNYLRGVIDDVEEAELDGDEYVSVDRERKD